MNKFDVPGIRARLALRLLATLVAGMLAGSALAAGCEVPEWDGKLPVAAPVLEPGTEWIFSAGTDYPSTTMHLEKVSGGQALFQINGDMVREEMLATYSDVNANRKGVKRILRFPLKAGDSWQDEFTEPGELEGRNEHYRYRYKEKATNTVLGVEEVTVAAGTFRALHVERIAHWVKDRPVALDGQKREAKEPGRAPLTDGYTITQLWYSPVLGRGVLKASLRIGDEHYTAFGQDLLKNANTSVVELVGFRNRSVSCDAAAPLIARQPEDYVLLGYDITPNDTWEWALRMRPHVPMDSQPAAKKLR
jgi:hypothetical protein